MTSLACISMFAVIGYLATVALVLYGALSLVDRIVNNL